jgi:hypothetical protein
MIKVDCDFFVGTKKAEKMWGALSTDCKSLSLGGLFPGPHRIQAIGIYESLHWNRIYSINPSALLSPVWRDYLFS